MNLAKLPLKIQDIAAARQRIGDAIYHSPCPRSLALSRLCGSQIYCKLDHLQMTGSFKERGARNRLMMLSPEQRKAGVIVASAGNHGLGISYHGRELRRSGHRGHAQMGAAGEGEQLPGVWSRNHSSRREL